jgi:hypothetical protein
MARNAEALPAPCETSGEDGGDEMIGEAIRQRLHAVFNGQASGPPLAELILDLFARQKASWPVLARACEDLDGMQRRTIDCGGFSVSVQCNPRRLVSSAAAVDAASLAKRPCFLCLPSLPAAQEAILYRGNYLVLCNPAPAFPAHFTIVHRCHIPQALAGHILDFMNLAEDLGPRFTVFYNGPRCGASAPDHLHFQVIPRGALPIERDGAAAAAPMHGGSKEATLRRLEGLGREAWMLTSRSRATLETLLRETVAALGRCGPSRGATDEEPMVNLLATFQDGTWRVILFPRAKHRPAVYSPEGEDGLLITPAAIEMAGIIITPREHDFHRLDAALVREIYGDVSLDAATAARAYREIGSDNS